MNSTSDYRQELTDKVIAMLEKGTAPWIRPWEDVAMPYNPNSSKAYRGMNAIALTMKSIDNNYTDPRWCTFKQASEKGWTINKGEKGTRIEYWKFHNTKDVKDEQGKTVSISEKLNRPQVFRAIVFNAQQMTGVPPYQRAEHHWQPEAEAEKILKNSGAKLDHKVGTAAYYSPSNDTIVLPERTQFKGTAEYCGTALHELGHWTCHPERLSRKVEGAFGSPDYAKEELRAELASYFLSAKLGIPHDTENHAAYIGSWVTALRSDKNEIFRAASDAEKITDYLLEFQKEKNIEKAQTESLIKTNMPVQKGSIARADIRLMVDIKEKDDAKALGARWDKELKTWYAPKGEKLDNLSVFMGEKVVNLRDTPIYVNFDDRAEAKQHGAWWDKDKKSWYMPAGSDIKNTPSKFFDPESAKEISPSDRMTFAEFAKTKGLLIEGEPAADGKIHRVSVEDGKPNARDGAYVYFDDTSGKAGWVRNFKSGFEGSYGESKERSGEIKKISTEEHAVRKHELDSQHDEAAKKAWYLCSKVFTKAPETHPYLQNKGIKPHDALVDKEGTLIVPLKNSEGKIRTFQRIADDGTKGFLKGAEQYGTSYWFGSPKDRVIVCEGFSTGASIYESTRIPTISAMHSGNLPTIAQQVREKYGERMNIVIAADNDHTSEQKIGYNPGIKFATEAAQKVNGTVVVPQFSEKEKTEKLTDFNDLMQTKSKTTVKEQIFEQAKELSVKSKEIER